MLKFDFLDKGLGIVSPAHFVYDLSTKMLLMLYSMGDVWIVIDCEPGCDVIDFEINLIFLIDPFFMHDQNVKTKT